MATKVIIRHKPANPLIGRRELSPADFKSIGIFTQKTQLVFEKENNWWLDADAAKVSKEALQWFEDSTEFTVERQEVDDEDPETLRHQEAYAASLGSAPQAASRAAASALGESKSESSTASAASTTTQSTAKS